MKRVINNKLFNTETAVQLASIDNNMQPPFDETIELFRKKTGEYFLHQRGGAETKHAELSSDGSWVAGESIVPLKFSDAMRWASQHLSPDEFESIFQSRSDRKKTITISIHESAVSRAKMAADSRGMRIGEYLEMLIDQNC